jgi:hypothetical protein
MRIFLAAIALLTLAGFAPQPEPAGEPDDPVRADFRRNSIEHCIDAARQPAPRTAAGFDWTGLCGCATDRVMAELDDAHFRETPVVGPAQREAIRQCVAELRRDPPDSTGKPG